MGDNLPALTQATNTTATSNLVENNNKLQTTTIIIWGLNDAPTAVKNNNNVTDN